jgi:hypothetical protein
MKYVIVAGIALALAAPVAAHAADSRYPNWPCHQLKVPTLSPAAVWTGPSIADIGDAWENDPKISDLAHRIAARRTPLEKAQKQAKDFLSETPKAEKKHKATLLFAGVFSILDGERSQVIAGIDRFSSRQQDLRDQLRKDLNKLRAAQDKPHPDSAAIDKLGTQVAWDTKVFDDRRQTIRYVCDVPAAIEHRLFSLARTIQQDLD